MDRVKISSHLVVLQDQNTLSHPQKCKISHNLTSWPASKFAILKSEERKFLCKIFHLEEVYESRNIAYVDDSVEIDPRNFHSNEIKAIDEIELVQEPPVEFNKIKVNVYIDFSNINLNIIRDSEDLPSIVLSVLKFYTFSTNCLISCNRYGISKILMLSTGKTGFGTINADCLLEIEDIIVERNLMKCNINVTGLEKEKKLLSDFIESNADYGNNVGKYAKRPSCQLLITGSTGCGKTSLINAVAHEHNCNVFEITADIFMPYPGETETELRKKFERIKAISKIASRNLSIILLENIEVFCPKFDAKMRENSHSSRIASFIFSFLDEVSRCERKILVIGTTSKVEMINPGLRRSTRMGSEIHFEIPDNLQRFKVMKSLCCRMLNIIDNHQLCQFVADNTVGYTNADLEILCQFVTRQHDFDSSAKNTRQLFERALKSTCPSVLRENFGTVALSTMTFSDIGGMDALKKSLQTCVLGPLRHPDKYHRLGLKSPSGILFYGPSGCAKTTIVKCLAGESKMTLISVSSAEIYSPYVGEAEKFIVKVFNQARLSAPAILFFDEIDTIVGSREKTNGMSDAHMRILSTLLTEIDGFCEKKSVLIIGATNRPECIDGALMRPGRFDKLIYIPSPDYDARIEILKFAVKKMPIADDVDVYSIAKRTTHFSGADLVNLCNEAAMCAATRDLNCDTITCEDFENCLSFLRPSLSEEKIQFYENFEGKHKYNGKKDNGT